MRIHTHYGFALQTPWGTPMAYAILRIKKLKTDREIRACGSHMFRTEPVQNADPSRQNITFCGSGNLAKDIAKRTPPKIRKNAVRAVEMLLTASPQHFKTPEATEAWLDSSIAWLEMRYGSNVVACVAHLDETTPHLSVVMVPRLGDRLTCDHFFGTPQKLSALQDDYAEHVKDLGLLRGIKKSKRHHESIRRFYGLCNEVEEYLDVPGTLEDALRACKEQDLHQSRTPTRLRGPS